MAGETVDPYIEVDANESFGLETLMTLEDIVAA